VGVQSSLIKVCCVIRQWAHYEALEMQVQKKKKIKKEFN
jgi:hypothetical protein